MHGLNLPDFSWDEVARDTEEFFDSRNEFWRCSRVGPANQCHWESHKWDCAIRRLGSIVLRLRRVRAGKPPGANVHFHKASQRFVSSNGRFAQPMVPTCRADERYKGEPFADASVESRQSNISINRGPIERRDWRRRSRGRVGLSNPTRVVAD